MFQALIRVFVVVFGNTMKSHESFVKNLKQSFNLEEVSSVNGCDAILAFVSVVSRVGTDIDAALQKIPGGRPVVLVVLHHTFDPYHVAPQSRLCVMNRSDVFAVDCLYYENHGLLRSLHNDNALKAVKQHLRDNVMSKKHLIFNIKESESVCSMTPTYKLIIYIMIIFTFIYIFYSLKNIL